MRWPLTVSVETQGGLRPVTRQVSGLRFSSVAPGGHGVCSFTLRKRHDELAGFGPASRVVVSDRRTGRRVFDGYADYPRPVRGEGADGFEVTAKGGRVLLSDDLRPRLFVDGPSIAEDDARWERLKMTAPGATVDFGSKPGSNDADTTPAIVLQFPSGQAVDNSSRSGVEYRLAEEAGVTIMYVLATMAPGSMPTDYSWEINGKPEGGGSRHHAAGADFYTTVTVMGGWAEFYADGSGLRPYLTDLRLRIARGGGATNVGSDTIWIAFTRIGLVARLAHLSGAQRSGSNYQGWLLGQGLAGPDFYPVLPVSWVVEDLIARTPAGHFDRAASYVDPTADHHVDQLAYPDGCTEEQVLADLAVLEPDYTWEVLADTGRGRVFNYRTWGDRYTIPRRAGVWEESGADTDLCNQILVVWHTRSGKTRSRIVTADVPALGTRVRDADPIELPTGLGSWANAGRWGEAELAKHNQPPESGRFTARGRVYDKRWGRWVEPWEVEAGWVATLQETGRSLRVTAVEADDDNGTAVLTLGEPSLKPDQRLAQLDSPRKGRRRRLRAPGMTSV